MNFWLVDKALTADKTKFFNSFQILWKVLLRKMMFV